MNALPALRPISIMPVLRPAFDNSRLSEPTYWWDDNAEALARYWHELTRCEGRPDPDFFRWLSICHDIELMRSKS